MKSKAITTIIGFIAFFFFSASDLQAVQIYTPDGTPVSEPIVDQPYGYTGRRYDKESGLHYFRARYYSSDQGHFISRDPVGYADGMGLYGGYFAENFHLDPSGTTTKYVTSYVNWEHWQRYRFYLGWSSKSAWFYAGSTWVDTQLDVTNTSVKVAAHLNGAGNPYYSEDAAPWYNIHESSVWLSFASSGRDAEATCPCLDEYGKVIKDKSWKGVYVYHGHIMAEEKKVTISKVTVNAGWEGEVPVGGKVKIGVGVEFKFNNKNQASAWIASAKVCPDGKGGIILSEQNWFEKINEPNTHNSNDDTDAGVVEGQSTRQTGVSHSWTSNKMRKLK